MSLIQILVIGWFDAEEAIANFGTPTLARPLTAEDVERLQVVCDALYRDLPRLAECHTEGVLEIPCGIVTPRLYVVVCVAREIFGMSAVDSAHRCMVYPEEELELPPRDEEIAWAREHTILRGDEVERHVDGIRALRTRRATQIREIETRVKALAAAHGIPPVPPPPVDAQDRTSS